MRNIFILAIIGALFPLSVLAHDSNIEHVHFVPVEEAKASLTVQGTAVVKDHKFTIRDDKIVKGKKISNSAIVNQTLVWEGKTYTYNPKTGKIVVRGMDDERHKLPAIKIVKVENGKVTIEYVAGCGSKAQLIEKKSK